MNSRWHILIVDASDQGASQLFREIQCDGDEPACERVATTQELLAALDRQAWDVILADDTTPPLDVPAIVALLAERRLDTPLIVASNSRDEERLVAYLRDGAADYLQRDRLARLRPAIERAIHGTLARRESRHVEALRQIESNYRMLMEQTTDAISIADAQGWYQEVNAAATNMLGYSREELLHMQVSDLITPAGLAQEPVHFDALRRGQIVLSERQLRCKNGQLINVETSARMLSNGQILAITRDITGRQQAEADLRHYAAELEGRNEELGAFAHTVAHDLSNPLGLVIGYAESLVAYHDTMAVNERLSCLDAIVRGAQKMNNIINELLLLSGVRDMVVEVTPLDMTSIVIEARQRLVDMIESTHAEILLPATWPVALGYEPWIEEVWANYLSNALKYAGRPPRLELGADPQPDQMVRFWIRDNGAGISPDAQARLFTPFTRLDRARAKGHGLGLSIVRRIVEKLGGQVGVESVVGQGSVFSFTLPAAST